MRFLNSAVDGVSCESFMIQESLLNYMAGDVCYVGFIDTNHNVKNNRYQMIGGSCTAIIGGYLYDIGLLQAAEVTRELWQPEDFSSDLLILKLDIHTTFHKIVDVKTNDVGDSAVTFLSLYMAILRTYAFNAKDVPWDERLIYHWTTTMWFTSFYKSDKTFCTNQRNIVTESIAMAFLFPRSGLQNPRVTTTETREHTFGGIRIV